MARISKRNQNLIGESGHKGVLTGPGGVVTALCDVTKRPV